MTQGRRRSPTRPAYAVCSAQPGGSQVRLTDLRPRVTLGRDLDGAVEQVRNLTSVAGAIERVGESAVLPAVRSALEPHVGDDGAVRLAGAAWLVTAVA